MEKVFPCLDHLMFLARFLGHLCNTCVIFMMTSYHGFMQNLVSPKDVLSDVTFYTLHVKWMWLYVKSQATHSTVWSTNSLGIQQRKHNSSALLALCEGNALVATSGFPSQRASHVENVSMLQYHHEPSWQWIILQWIFHDWNFQQKSLLMQITSDIFSFTGMRSGKYYWSKHGLTS